MPDTKTKIKKPKVAKPKDDTDQVSSKIKIPKKEKNEENQVVLRIRVRAYESKILDASVKQIIDTAMRYDATIVGPVPLPTEIKNTQTIVLLLFTKIHENNLK